MIRSIVVVGMGYVGTVTAACLAGAKHAVTGIDISQERLDLLTSTKRSGFEEKALDEVVERALTDGSLQLRNWNDLKKTSADIIFICVNTPDLYGKADVSRVKQAVELCLGAFPHINSIVIRSTVPPGTTAEIATMVQRVRGNQAPNVIHNPEFLREGRCIEDFNHPAIVVAGVDKPSSARDLTSVLLGCTTVQLQRFFIVDTRTSEMLKYACNAFHATKIAFANEIGVIASSLGASATRVMEILKEDRVLNSSSAYLFPGFAYGGPCLPKDLQALISMAAQNRKTSILLEGVQENNRALIRAVARSLAMPSKTLRIKFGFDENLPNFRRIGIYGISFKRRTLDPRCSQVLDLIEEFNQYYDCDPLGLPRPQLLVYDPNPEIWSRVSQTHPALKFKTEKESLRSCDIILTQHHLNLVRQDIYGSAAASAWRVQSLDEWAYTNL